MTVESVENLPLPVAILAVTSGRSCSSSLSSVSREQDVDETGRTVAGTDKTESIPALCIVASQRSVNGRPCYSTGCLANGCGKWCAMVLVAQVNDYEFDGLVRFHAAVFIAQCRCEQDIRCAHAVGLPDRYTDEVMVATFVAYVRFQPAKTRRPTNWWGSAKRVVTHPTMTVVYNTCYHLFRKKINNSYSQFLLIS